MRRILSGLSALILCLSLLTPSVLATDEKTYFVFPTDPPSPTAPVGWAYPIPLETLTDDAALLILVNRVNRLDEDYPPMDGENPLVDTTVRKRKDLEMLAHPEASAALVAMFEAAAADSMRLVLHSAYRSYRTQAITFENNVKKNDGDTGYVQPAGASEHQTGLAFDIVNPEWIDKSFSTSFEKTAEAQWMAAHCAEYGFILRYPKNSTKETGVRYEPWHLRYVGPRAARYITDSGLTLEAFTIEWQDALAAWEAATAAPAPPAEP